MSNQLTFSAVIASIVMVAAIVAVIVLRGGADVDEMTSASGTSALAAGAAPADEQGPSPAAV